MSRGKRYADEGFDLEIIPWKKIGIVVLVIVVVAIGIFGGKKAYSTLIANGKLFDKNVDESTADVVSIEEEKIPNKISNYNVLGELKISNKNFSQYILDVEENENSQDSNNSLDNTLLEEKNTVVATDKKNNDESNSLLQISDSLKYGLVKLYGNNDINTKGNFCIIGHNEEKYFSILNELNIDDKFSIKSSTNVEKNYIITDIYTIDPTDLKCLMPNENYIEVTLITCATGSNQRLVIKGIEEQDYEKYKMEKENNAIAENDVLQDSAE